MVIPKYPSSPILSVRRAGISSCSSTHSSAGISSCLTNRRVSSTMERRVSPSAIGASFTSEFFGCSLDVVLVQSFEMLPHFGGCFRGVPGAEVLEKTATRLNHVDSHYGSDLVYEIEQNAHQRLHHHDEDRIF